jgi:anti-sigma regulatory factor (Ser/Thr protein kinase)
VEHLDAAYARIWTLDADDQALVLQASAGVYTDLDGDVKRVPVGQMRVGLIAQEKRPYITNDIPGEEPTGGQVWVRPEGMVAFAGYPLMLQDRVIGVVALFARHALPADTTTDGLASVADALAQGVERRQVEERLAESEARQRIFFQEALASVTGGRLRLCNDATDLPDRLPGFGDGVALTPHTLKAARRRTTEAAQAAGLVGDRASDLLTAVGEATMNAVTHARDGTAHVCADVAAGMVQVWVEDRGGGIEVARLPQATLERGYTTAGTLGHGFKMMLQTSDRLWLLTSPSGTTVVLELGREEPVPSWLNEK